MFEFEWGALQTSGGSDRLRLISVELPKTAVSQGFLAQRCVNIAGKVRKPGWQVSCSLEETPGEFGHVHRWVGALSVHPDKECEEPLPLGCKVIPNLDPWHHGSLCDKGHAGRVSTACQMHEEQA